jgi:hypothetical protein
MLDPASPVDRRVGLALRHLGITADDVGPEAVESLRFRLAQDDADQLVRTLARTGTVEIGHVPFAVDTAAHLEALAHQIGQD